MASMKPLLIVSLLALSGVCAQAKDWPGRLKFVSIAGGELRRGGRAVTPGEALEGGVSLQLTGGAKAIFEAQGFGKLMMRGPANFTPRGARATPGLDLTAGGVLTRLRDLEGMRFSIGTPAAVAAVRGTTFFVEARGRRTMYLCVCEGSVAVLGRGERFKTTVASTGEHKPFLLQMTSAGQGVQADAAMERHTDADIEELK